MSWSCEQLAECHRALDAKDAVQAHVLKQIAPKGAR